MSTLPLSTLLNLPLSTQMLLAGPSSFNEGVSSMTLLNSIFSKPHRILNVWIKSPLCRLVSSVVRPSWFNLIFFTMFMKIVFIVLFFFLIFLRFLRSFLVVPFEINFKHCIKILF
jgi:hypothetical protein